MSDESIKDVVKQKYGQAALRVVGGGTSCCRTPGKAEQHRICQSIDSSFDEHLNSSGVWRGVRSGQFARLRLARSSRPVGACSHSVQFA